MISIKNASRKSVIKRLDIKKLDIVDDSLKSSRGGFLIRVP